jgi:uncharacterized protein (TIGR00369 family)
VSDTLPNEVEARTREIFSGHGFMRLLGARITALGRGLCEVRVPFSPDLTQQDGHFHAGVSAAIADSAAGCAAHTLMDPASNVVAVEYKINLLAPARGRELVARARVVRPGRTLVVCAADVYGLDGEEETLCATTLTTMMELRERTPSGDGGGRPRGGSR